MPNPDQDHRGLFLTGDEHHKVIEEFTDHFEKNMGVGPGMYTALLGNFLGRVQYYVTHGSDIPEEDFLKMIEENRKLGYLGMAQEKPPEKH